MNKLHEYAKDGDISNLSIVLNDIIDINTKDVNGDTALTVAAGCGHIDCVQLLLDRNADVNSKDNRRGMAALIVAAIVGKIECMRLLLERGADVNSRDNDGHTSLLFATQEGKIECMRLLLDRNADVNIKDNKGCTALISAAEEGYIECARLLLDRNADVDSKNIYGYTAVFVAAIRGDIECMRLLLDRNADVSEDIVKSIPNPKGKQMILDEIAHRRRRAVYDAFINRHIEYPPFKSRIYERIGDLRLGWTRAEAVRYKYYFDEMLFYVHMHVANVVTRSVKKYTNDTDRVISTCECKDHFASSSNKTFTLMTVLVDRLKEYLKPKIDLCSKCCKEGTNVCSRCRTVYYCSPECQKSHWKTHKLVCKAPSSSS